MSYQCLRLCDDDVVVVDDENEDEDEHRLASTDHKLLIDHYDQSVTLICVVWRFLTRNRLNKQEATA